MELMATTCEYLTQVNELKEQLMKRLVKDGDILSTAMGMSGEDFELMKATFKLFDTSLNLVQCISLELTRQTELLKKIESKLSK